MKKNKFLITVLIFLIIVSGSAYAKQYNERYYQNKWCSQWYGKQEVRLLDMTRADCVTKNYIVEFDFTKKWAECFGQATHYADLTGKNPACILIIEQPKDFITYYKVKQTFKKHNVTLWYMKSPLYGNRIKN